MPADPSSDALLVLEREPFVSLTAFRRSRSGTVAPDAPRFAGRGEVLTAPADVQHVLDCLAPKYGLQFRLVNLLERLPRRNRRPRMGLRITPQSA